MKKILIVDDQELVRWGLSRTIRNIDTVDSEIKAVDNMRDAAAEIGSRKYDLCFLDVRMPDGNGLHLMKEARLSSPRTKVVVMSAYELDDAARKEIKEHAYRFVPKPFDILKVREIVEGALADNPPMP